MSTSASIGSSLESRITPAPLIVAPDVEFDPFAEPEEPQDQFLPEYQPFPVDCLPGPVARFVSAKAVAINADPATLGLFALSTLAAAIGKCRRLKLKESWQEPAILWTAVIRDGQTCHDAALAAVTEPQADLDARFQTEQTARYDRRMKRLFQSYSLLGLPDETPEDRVWPTKPTPVRSLTRDVRMAALARLLKGQSTGLLLANMELEGWLGKGSGNSPKAANERQVWFDLHAGRSVTLETTSSKPAIPLQEPSLSVTGVLSDEALSKKLLRKEGPCGLASRLLFAAPPSHLPHWTDRDVDPQMDVDYQNCLRNLRSLADQAQPSPVVLSDNAHRLFAEFLYEVGRQQPLVDEALAVWQNLLPRQAARLALVIHLTRCVAGDCADPQTCDEVSMQSAIDLAWWFAGEAQRVVQRMSFTNTRRDQQQLLEWVTRHERGATPRELCRSNGRKYPTVEAAKKAMEELSQSQMAVWVNCDPGPEGGRPTRRLVSFYGVPMEAPVMSNDPQPEPIPAEVPSLVAPDAPEVPSDESTVNAKSGQKKRRSRKTGRPSEENPRP